MGEQRPFCWCAGGGGGIVVYLGVLGVSRGGGSSDHSAGARGGRGLQGD